MAKKLFSKIVLTAIILVFSAFFVIKFGGPSILKFYIETGIGDCKKIPILCLSPGEEMANASVDEEYVRHLITYKFPKMSISAPVGFTLVQERIRKVYNKKRRQEPNDSILFIDRQDKDFLINLFPQLKKEGIVDDFGLMKHVMSAKIENIKNLTDTFFVILKSIFTPNLGDNNNIQMLLVSVGDKRCFVNYSLSESDNYFDINAFDKKGNYFKVYIKDAGAKLDLNKALAIISTAHKTD